jgi:hypothetical protein
MSFGTVTPQSRERKLLNISGKDRSSNQQAVAVPYGAGVFKVGLTWICPRYNTTVKKVTSSSGGKASSKGAEAPAQKKYRADICGIACYCPDDAPVDSLLYVLINDEVAFSGPLNRTAGQHFAAFSLQQYCQDCRIWWGTKDSPLDTHILSPRGAVSGGIDPRDKRTWPIDATGGGTVIGGELVAGLTDPKKGHYDPHSGYRNICRFGFKQFHLGFTKNMPNVVVILKRGCKFFAGRLEAADEGVDPMGPAFEIVTDDLAGAGLPAARLDEPSWQATATVNGTNSLKVAPLITQAVSLRSVFADLLSYYNGWFRTKGTLLEAGVYLTGNFDQSALLTLGDDDLAGEPAIKPGTLDDTFNYFALVFTNRAHWYNDDDVPARYVDDTNFRKVGERRPKWIQMPWFIEEAIAIRYITARGMMEALEPQSGSATFRRERVAALLPGSLFKLNASSYSQTFLLRVKKKKQPASRDGTAVLTVEREAGTWPAIYNQPGNVKPEDFLLTVAAIGYRRIAELPIGLRLDPAITEIVVLALRSVETAIGFNIHFSADNVTYEQIATQNHFAIMGRIASAAYPNTTADVDTTVGATIDLFGYDLDHVVAQSDQARDDNTLLLWMDDEIMSVGGITALGSGRYTVYTKRARFNTIKATHAIGADCWFMFRSDLLRLTNRNFVGGATVYFKLQPFSETVDYDVALATAIAYTLANPGAYSAPAVTPGSGTFTAGFNASVMADAGLVVRYRLDGGSVNALSLEWPKSGGSYTTLAIPAATTVLKVKGFAPDGTETEEITVVYTLVSSGSSGGTTTGGVTYTYTGNRGHQTIAVTPHCATSGATIHYRVYDIGSSPPAFGTSGSTNVALDKQMDAYASSSGNNDSPISTITNPDMRTI